MAFRARVSAAYGGREEGPMPEGEYCWGSLTGASEITENDLSLSL